MEQKFGGLDWAIFAYHCGQGCVAEMLDLTRRARGIPKDQVTVPRMFFAANPAWNRELYQAIQQQMQRDYSPTYYFRVMRAEQLLALYRSDPEEFARAGAGIPERVRIAPRAPHRLSVWLRRDDLVFHSGDDIRADDGRRLVSALDRPSISAIALALLPGFAVEPRVLFARPRPRLSAPWLTSLSRPGAFTKEMKPKGEKFRALPVTSLVEPEDFARQIGQREGLPHCSGQVFDIDYSSLPPGEVECLRFVLNDLGWDGYLGFVEEGRDNLHIGCSPGSRDFFAAVFEEAVGISRCVRRELIPELK